MAEDRDVATKVFVSYAGRDRAWAEWVAWELEKEGFSVDLDRWDWWPGGNVVLRMSDALSSADLIVTLWSSAYFERQRFTTAEWTAAMAERLDDTGHTRLIPLRIEEASPPSVLRPLGYRDLFDVGEKAAREVLLSAVSRSRLKPLMPPEFPEPVGAHMRESPGRVSDGPRLPGSLPEVHKLPGRPLTFTGRDGLLVGLRERLKGDRRVVVQALQGLGGVGKTTLAIEYAHRFSGSYDLIWWIDSERLELIDEQLAGLAVEAGWVSQGADTPAAVAAVRRRLAGMTRWLLVFDNAEEPAAVMRWLPHGPGHVLVTSRNPNWSGTTSSIELDVFSRGESIELLRTQVPALSEDQAERLAAKLGDLPLALAQAAGVMAETQMQPAEYLSELECHPAAVLDEGAPLAYGNSLSAVVSVAIERLNAEDLAAGQMVKICAFLAPEPIPVDLFITAAKAGTPSDPLASQAQTPYGVRHVMKRIGRYGLGQIGSEGLVMHRLTQAVLRDSMDDVERQVTRAQVEAIVAAAAPSGSQEPGLWKPWARLLPHLLALEPTTSDNRRLLEVTNQAAWYLLNRAELSAGKGLAERLHARAIEVFGRDDPTTLDVSITLGRAHRELGDFNEALELDSDTLVRRHQRLGEDDQKTLYSALCVALVLGDLGRHEEARNLNASTLEACRRVLHEEHPDTLTAAHGLAGNYRSLGQHGEARDLDRRTLELRRQTLGANHPHTLRSAYGLAADLRGLEQYEEARKLDEETLTCRRLLLGDDHPETLRSADGLAADLRGLHQYEEARRLDDDTLGRRTSVLGDQHPDTLESRGNLLLDLQGIAAITTDSSNGVRSSGDERDTATGAGELGGS